MEYKNKVIWDKEKEGIMEWEGKARLRIGTPPEFQGSENVVSPEELFVASINGCIMTTFLYFSEKLDIGLVSYESDGFGKVEKNEKGYKFTNIVIKPTIIAKDVEKAMKALKLTEKYCLVSRSVSANIEIKPKIKSG
ncbi:MAG: OsmC family protein [Candidatus Thermoplasmatota archaeon]